MATETVGLVGLAFAFGAGVLSFFSPCHLPLVPAYFAYLGGSAVRGAAGPAGRLLLVRRTVFFVLGFTLVFVLLGATATAVGSFLAARRDTLRELAGLVIVGFGIWATGLLPWGPLYGQRGVAGRPLGHGDPAAFLLGLSFALAWTPCVGPALASILVYAGSIETVSAGLLLLAAYSLGLGLPFIGAALFFERFSALRRAASRFVPRFSLLLGAALVVFGILVYFDLLAWLTPTF